MYGNSSLIYLTKNQSDSVIEGGMALRSEAGRLFCKLFAGSLWRRMGSLVGRQPANLKSLKSATAGREIENSHQVGATVVPIDRITGSEGRSQDFDREFRPLKAFNYNRWVGVAVAMMQGKTMPPVELIQIGDEYFVRDGHHRISAARALGQLSVDAIVTSWSLA